MTSLRRLLKRKFLTEYLELACRAFEVPFSIAVLSDGRVLASAGEGGNDLSADTSDVVTFPLHVGGVSSGQLVMRNCAQNGANRDALRRSGDVLALAIQAQVDSAEAGRAMTSETLDVYRELSLLHRAAVSLNQSLGQGDVARSLLVEFQKGSPATQWGAVFVCDDKGDHFSLLDGFGDPSKGTLDDVLASQLFSEIIQSEKGEVMNDLAANPRWDRKSSALATLLIMPLVAHERCTGALVLGSGSIEDEYTAGDLTQASALAAIAAEVLYNARLFEEVVEAKNFNENILENLSNGVITLDLALRVTKTNAAARRILHLAERSIVGTSIADFFTDENAWVLGPLSPGKIGEEGVHWADRDIKLGKGEGITVNLSAVPLKNVDGKHIGYMLVFEDITREKRIKGTMARFMSERVVEKVMDAGESVLGGTSQDVTILFSDIRNFTGLSELMNPRQMVGTLNDYFTEMVDVIFEHGGTLDKFIGDAIMAVFGAPFITPDDPDKAAHTAIEMMARLEAFNKRQIEKAASTLDIGVGINSGTVVAGTIGSPRRMDYTVIGDQVNLAARIESANKYYGTKILVSEHTAARFGQTYRMREIDRVKVTGRQAPVGLFDILDHHTEETFPGVDTVIAAYSEGLHHYRQQRWSEGAKYFAEALQANPNDRPTQIFLHRCWTFAAQPPDESWNGVTEL
jgi:PAS domain S-box-containing protein